METIWVKYNKKPENVNPKIFKTKNGRMIMKPKCVECGFKKSRFVKEQEAKDLLSNLGIKTSVEENSIAKGFVLDAIPLSI